MVGFGGCGEVTRSKEAVGMMALHETLKNMCLSSDWTYSIFKTIRPRPRCKGSNSCKDSNNNNNMMLMWENENCRIGGVTDCVGEIDDKDGFNKMSI